MALGPFQATGLGSLALSSCHFISSFLRFFPSLSGFILQRINGNFIASPVIALPSLLARLSSDPHLPACLLHRLWTLTIRAISLRHFSIPPSYTFYPLYHPSYHSSIPFWVLLEILLGGLTNCIICDTLSAVLKIYKCKRCGHEWAGRKTADGDKPMMCPKCRSAYWDRDRVRGRR